MPRKPTKTIRIDLQTHFDLQELARRYGNHYGRHHSLADMIRIGVTLSMSDYLRREHASSGHRTPAERDEGVLPF